MHLRCRFDKMCMPFNSVLRINPSSQLILDGLCIDGCTYATYIDYSYEIFENNTSNNWKKFDSAKDFIKGRLLVILVKH